jgi:hypothetical protein
MKIHCHSATLAAILFSAILLAGNPVRADGGGFDR